jgi:AcrR family transcriptional regulator
MQDKRQVLVDTAMELFYAKGINTIGINEILKSSGIAKKTLYHHFDSKEALILSVLTQRHRIFIDWLSRELRLASTNEQVITTLFTALGQWFSSEVTELGPFRGCLFINTAAEFSDPKSKISLMCQIHKQQVRHLIAQQLTQPSAVLLDAVCMLKEGAITSAYVAHDHHAAQKCIPILKALLA